MEIHEKQKKSTKEDESSKKFYISRSIPTLLYNK